MAGDGQVDGAALADGALDADGAVGVEAGQRAHHAGDQEQRPGAGGQRDQPATAAAPAPLAGAARPARPKKVRAATTVRKVSTPTNQAERGRDRDRGLILLAGLTIIFLLAVVTLQPIAIYSGAPQSIFVLVSLLVCLIPTTIGGLLSAIGIAGMDRVVQRNVLAMSGRAVEAAGDVDILLLDKTGTITLGNRRATEFIPAPGVKETDLADAAQLASLADETPEGRSIVVLAKEKYGLRGRDLATVAATFIPFLSDHANVRRRSGWPRNSKRRPHCHRRICLQDRKWNCQRSGRNRQGNLE